MGAQAECGYSWTNNRPTCLFGNRTQTRAKFRAEVAVHVSQLKPVEWQVPGIEYSEFMAND
jgi:hypothetical protein